MTISDIIQLFHTLPTRSVQNIHPCKNIHRWQNNFLHTKQFQKVDVSLTSISSRSARLRVHQNALRLELPFSVQQNEVSLEVWNLTGLRRAASTTSSSSQQLAGVTSSILRTGAPKLGAVKTYHTIMFHCHGTNTHLLKPDTYFKRGSATLIKLNWNCILMGALRRVLL